MIVSRILAAGLLAVSTLAAPSPVQQEDPPQTVGRWLLRAHRHSGGNSTCVYDVDFFKNIFGTPVGTFEFTVSGTGDQPSLDVGGGVDVDGNGKYLVNDTYIIWTGWSPPNWIDTTVVDTIRKAWARFSIRSWIIGMCNDGYFSAVYAFAYEDLGEIPPLNLNWDGYSADVPARLRIHDEAESDEDDFWQIQGMNRDYRAASHLTYLDFTIVLADGKRENCHLIVPETEPDSSFYAVPCGVSGYTVSWGYKADTDGGVMTICNPALHKNAWFGWDGIGRRSYLGDSPRNVARTVDCE